jgi:hypothetical protein
MLLGGHCQVVQVRATANLLLLRGLHSPEQVRVSPSRHGCGERSQRGIASDGTIERCGGRGGGLECLSGHDAYLARHDVQERLRQLREADISDELFIMEAGIEPPTRANESGRRHRRRGDKVSRAPTSRHLRPRQRGVSPQLVAEESRNTGNRKPLGEHRACPDVFSGSALGAGRNPPLLHRRERSSALQVPVCWAGD